MVYLSTSGVKRKEKSYSSDSSQTLAVRLRKNLIQGGRLLLRSKTLNEPANCYWNEARVDSNTKKEILCTKVFTILQKPEKHAII